MDYEKLWNDLKEQLRMEINVFKNGTMMSMAESIHGEHNYTEILDLMKKMESNVHK